MTEHDKSALEVLRHLTLQLMLIAAAVFSVVGGFVASSQRVFKETHGLIFSLSLFALSILCGYLIHGALISQLRGGRFNPFTALITTSGIVQIVAFLLGGVLFIIFCARNI